MSESDLTGLIRKLEAQTGVKTLVLGASNIETDLLPQMYETLRRTGRVDAFDVVVHLRGGEVNAARRLALLLHGFTDRLRFLVPHYCESSGTVMALAAHEIVAGPMAAFSPIDPHFAGAEGQGGGPSALSAQDIRLFAAMSRAWFGLEEQQARAQALPVLCENIFPTTLTAFYRATRELEAIGDELLALHMDVPEKRAAIVNALLYDYHSHAYALTGDELRRLGLPVIDASGIEDAIWRIACAVRQRIGPESRETLQENWRDALIATADGTFLRGRNRERPMGRWEPETAA